MGDEADADWESGMIEAGRALVVNDMRDKLHGASKAKRYRSLRCVECRQNLADLPSLRCVGCDAYREHTGHF
jgi:hypothetical protein